MDKESVLIDTAVGVTFGKQQHYIRNLVPGQPLRLVREPSNPFDTNAVAIWDTSDHILGYLTRQLAVTLAPAFEDGSILARVYSVGRCSTWGPYGFRFEYKVGKERAANAPSRKRTHASIYS